MRLGYSKDSGILHASRFLTKVQKAICVKNRKTDTD